MTVVICASVLLGAALPLEIDGEQVGPAGDQKPDDLSAIFGVTHERRELREDADTAQYLGVVTAGAMNPTARVEYALRADDMLSEPQVRQIMEYYLAVRMRRFGRPLADRRSARSPSDHAARRAVSASRLGKR